ncbi:MAG: ATP-grasp domain-containing protein, partial [Polyangiaceae bacterium]
MAILPGATIGIFGGGQLGRMTAMAARSLGYHVHALDPDESCAARFVVERCITAPFDDEFAAADLARRSQVVTLEIEKVAQKSLTTAARYAPVRPSADVLGIVQDRARQKKWLADNGFPVGDYREATDAAGLEKALTELAAPAFVKATRGGYDGRGQVFVAKAAEAKSAWEDLAAEAVVAERALA